jgi:hypothetical protein
MMDKNNDTLSTLEPRISIVRDNIGQLIEQAAGEVVLVAGLCGSRAIRKCAKLR